MGYSNNKWRKILTILMIINLCFILFAKFSKVFGATITIDDVDYTTSTFFDENVATKNVIIFYSPVQNKYACIACDEPVTANLISGTNYHFHGSSNYLVPTEGWVTNLQDIFSATNYFHSLEFNRDTDISNVVYTNHDIYDSNGNLILSGNIFAYPFFTNNTEIEDGNPDGVFINAGDFTNTDTIYFHLLEITNGLANGDSSLYYYNDKIFALDKDSDYYRTYADIDPNSDLFYYYIPRYKLGLSQNTSYLYVLNNSKNQIQNSYGVYEKDFANGIFDVVESDTTGVITATEEENDRMKNIENSIINNEETTNNINNSLTNTTVTEDTQTDIDGSLNFNNQNEGLTNLNNGFFTRLTTMLTNLLGYNLAEDTAVNIPLPNSNKSLTLHSIDIYNNVTGAIRLIINAFWVYIFSFYMWKFINKIYIAISTGHILDTFSSSGEAITNNML